MEKIQKIVFLILAILLLPAHAQAATLSISPTSGTFEVGDRVTARVIVSSDLPVNAISGVVSIPQIFVVESVSKANSILNFWVSEPNFSRGAGTLHFEGVALGGYTQRTGTIVTFILRAEREGTGTINFQSGQVLANDGQGTNLTSGFGSSSFTVIPDRTPEPTPDTPDTTDGPEKIIEDETIEEPQEEASLAPPKIKLTNINRQDTISGSSNYANSQALITFTSENGVNIFVQSETDSDGNFFSPIPQTLKRGLYTVSAVVIQKDLSHTSPSNEITVNVGNIFSDISVEIRLAITLLAVVTLYLLIQAIRHFFSRRRRKAHIHQESKEAQKIVHQAFKTLNKDISGLAPIREIKKDLKNSEKSIVEEIKDIEEA